MSGKTTRGANGGGSIRKRSDGRWEARYSLGFDPKTGKQIQKSIYGKTQKEVRQKLNKTSTEIDEGTYFEPNKMTLSQWLDTWLNEYSGDKKYLTVKGYKAQCSKHIKPALGDVQLHKLTPVMVQKFYNALQKGTEDEPGLSPKSVKNVHGILRKALQQAVTNGYIRSNPCVGTVLPRVEKPSIKPLTDAQVAALLKAADKDIEYGSIIKLAILTGLRQCEALGLTWDCVDFEKGCITVNKQLQKRPRSAGGFAFAPLKNDKVRVIKPAPFVMDLLKTRYCEQAAQRLSAAEAWEGWNNEKERRNYLVFTTLTGAHLGPNTFYNHFKKLAAQIGAPDARVHDMRHTYAVLSLQNGDDIKTVQGNLGHATASFTLDVYGHVSEQMKDASAQRMQQYLENLSLGSA